MSSLDWLTARPVAHRGLHGPGAVENTPTAFAAAAVGSPVGPDTSTLFGVAFARSAASWRNA